MRRFLALLVLGVLTGSQAAAFKCGMDGKTTGRIAYYDGPPRLAASDLYRA